MAFDPSKYVQPPTSPVDWARLRQSSQDSFNNQLAQQQAQRQQQRQFDVEAPMRQQQIDETARSNRVAEGHAASVLEHQMGVEDRRRKEETYKTVSGLYRKAVITGDVKGLNLELGLLGQSGLVDTIDGMHKGLAERGVALVPGRAPQRQAEADYRSALDSIPGALAELPDASSQPYSEDVGQKVLGTTAPADRPAKGVPAITDKPPPVMSEDEQLELLNRRPPDLQAEAQGRDEARRKSRFEEARAQLEGLKLPPVVRDQAVNQLADVTGQARPYQTVVLPTAAPAPKPTEPGAPVDAAAAMPQGIELPQEALSIITAAGDDAPSFASQALAEGGGYHAVDLDSGQVIADGSLLEAHEEWASGIDTMRDEFVGSIQDPYVKKLFEADFEAIKNGMDPGESRQRVEMLMRDRQAAAARASAERRAQTMAGIRTESGDRADAGQDIQRINAKRSVEKEIVDRIASKNGSMKASLSALSSLQTQARTLAGNPNSLQQRNIRRDMALALGERLTDADFKDYVNRGLITQLEEMKEELLGDAQLSPERLKDMQKAIVDLTTHVQGKVNDMAERLHVAIKHSVDLRDLGESDEEREDRAERVLEMLIPGFKAKPPRKGKTSAASDTRSSTSSSTSSEKAVESDKLLQDIGFEETP